MRCDSTRRKILKASTATLLVGTAGILYKNNVYEDKDRKNLNNPDSEQTKNNKLIVPAKEKENVVLEHELAVRDNLSKVEKLNQIFSEDLFLIDEKKTIFKNTLERILRVKKVIGYANFNLLGFDEMILYAHRFPQIGKFRKDELKLIDELFFYDANEYGFYGNKVIKNLTENINKNETIKIKGSGHYLFKGDAFNKFLKLKKDVGEELILTSGVRSVVKQLQLFLSKLNRSNGNLSLTSRSLAPPGHSYHGIGDFDVGKKGFGKRNFTSQFSHTKEYGKLIELKYVDLRYMKGNQLGVRYEPWHIKVV